MKNISKEELKNQLRELNTARSKMLSISLEPGHDFQKDLEKILPHLGTSEFDNIKAESIVDTFEKRTQLNDSIKNKIEVEINRITKELE